MTKNKNPLITVLLPVYNTEKYIKEAIESILNQTYQNFELLIINDGSTDHTKKTIEAFTDERIILINNKSNIKLIKTLNKGLNIAKGEYIARMDADDISLPNRLSEQVEFMNKYPEIGISGTWAKTIGDEPKTILRKSISNEDIKAKLLFQSAFIHPSVIIRKSIIKKYNLYYNENYPHSEDRELWARASSSTKLANLDKVLLYYRTHKNSIGKIYSNIQKESANKTIINQLKKLGIGPSQKELELHRAIKKPKDISTKKFLKQINNWYQKLINLNHDTKTYNEASLIKILSRRWFNICYNLPIAGFSTWKLYHHSSFSKQHSKKDIIKFFIRIIIRKTN